MQIIGDDAAAGSEAGLHPWFTAETLLDRLSREQSRADHDGGIAGIRATGDGCDHHRAIADRTTAAVVLHVDRLGRFGPVEGLEQILLPLRFHLGQWDAVLRALRSGERSDDRRQVELERRGELRLGCVIGAEEPLLLVIAIDEVHLLGGTAGAPEKLQRFVVDGEEAHRGAVLGSHVCQRRAIGETHLGKSRSVELHELPNDTMFPQHLRDGEDEIGGGGPFLEFSGELEANHFWREHVNRLAEHDRLGLDAADAPTDDSQTVDHRRVAVGADEAVGESDSVPREDDLREVLEVDLVHDAGGWWNHAEVVEGFLPPAEELVTFLIALELDVDILLK